MKVKEKYRTIEVSGKRIVETDWKDSFLVEDDFNEKDFDWDKFFDVKPITYQMDGKGESGIPTTYSSEIKDVVEGEEYSETSSHDFGTSPHKLITQDGETYHTDSVRDDKGTWTKEIKGFYQSWDTPDAQTTD
jgi:hypothetical protein